MSTVCPEVFPEFRDSTYAGRYEILLTKMVRERLYDSACLLLAANESERWGEYREPADELCFERFMTALLARAIAAGRIGG